jgi:hypothetical protein
MFDLENVRPLSFVGIGRLTFFAYRARGFGCLFTMTATAKTLRLFPFVCKSFDPVPNYL